MDTQLKKIVHSFCMLDTSILTTLDSKFSYSYNYKGEFIEEMKGVFKSLKSKGIKHMTVKESKCIYCYPTNKAYSFHHPTTDELIIRYVIFQQDEKVFRVEECKNNQIAIIPKSGLPF